jgi:Type IV secretion system pilin
MKHHITAFAVLLAIGIPLIVGAQVDTGLSNLPGSEFTNQGGVTAPQAGSGVNTPLNAAASPSPVDSFSSGGTGLSGSSASLGTGAADITTGPGNSGGATITTIPNATPIKETTTGTVKLENPLGNNVRSIPDFFYLVINFVYSLSYAVIAGFLLVSGFKFVMAQGKPDALDDAKKTFKYTIIGAIILIGANVATEVVRSVINQFVATSI